VTRELAYAVALAIAAVSGWGIPALAMRALAPSLEASPLVSENYRGRKVFLGLGLVWAVWTVSLFAASAALDAVAGFAEPSYGSVEMLLFDGPLTMPVYAVPMILVLASILFGMADDVFGTRADKGFRGHLSALLHGRLTTGGMKLLGIGVVSAVYGWYAVADSAKAEGVPVAIGVGWWVAATLVIAFSANLLNLLDLRPGRALKSYAAFATLAGVLFGLDAVEQYQAFTAESAAGWTQTDTLVTLAALLLVLLGPVFAVWRLDLGERGMLGDAGSNAMGAIVGYLLAGALPLPWLAAAAFLLAGLNLLSERLSFSTIIEKVPPLRFVDRLGRGPDEADRGPGSK